MDRNHASRNRLQVCWENERKNGVVLNGSSWAEGPLKLMMPYCTGYQLSKTTFLTNPFFQGGQMSRSSLLSNLYLLMALPIRWYTYSGRLRFSFNAMVWRWRTSKVHRQNNWECLASFIIRRRILSHVWYFSLRKTEKAPGKRMDLAKKVF